CLVFFFQAEDGIRDRNVTGVQTCALPIFIFLAEDSRAVAGVARFWTCRSQRYSRPIPGALGIRREKSGPLPAVGRDRRSPTGPRSEERRVGKEEGTRGEGCETQNKQTKSG